MEFTEENLKKLEDVLSKCYGHDTVPTSAKEKVKNNILAGQCVPASLIVNDSFGGDLKFCKVGEIFHCFNEIEGQIVDLTAGQFEGENPIREKVGTVTREWIFETQEDIANRYSSLKARVYQQLGIKEIGEEK